MTLIESRVKECFWLFSLTLPISKSYQKKMSAVLGDDIVKIIPQLLQVIADICNKNPEEFAGYLEFVGECYDYMRGYRDNIPQVELEGEAYQEFMQEQLKKQREKMKK